MRGTELQGRRVVTEAGKRLGRVAEIHVRDGEVTTVVTGGGGLLQRFISTQKGHAIRWDKVRRITPREIVVAG